MNLSIQGVAFVKRLHQIKIVEVPFWPKFSCFENDVILNLILEIKINAPPPSRIRESNGKWQLLKNGYQHHSIPKTPMNRLYRTIHEQNQ